MLMSDDPQVMIMDIDLSPFVVAGVALLLLIAAQTFINQMLEGDQGLGAYLRDGSGYNKSGFRTVGPNRKKKKNTARTFSESSSSSSSDPLPWLKLPQLTFVEVAGQEQRQFNDNNEEEAEEEEVYRQLESLRTRMNDQLEAGKIKEATALRKQLEGLMKANGIDFQAD
jgi:hypothetical protein